MFVVVIDDDIELNDKYLSVLRRLRAQHEMVWVSVGDSIGMDMSLNLKDIDDIAVFPEYIKKDRSVIDSLEQAKVDRLIIKSKQLDRLGITNCRVAGDMDVIKEIFKLLERHKNARKY